MLRPECVGVNVFACFWIFGLGKRRPADLYVAQPIEGNSRPLYT
jgi:hypothetical protein